MNRLEGLPVCYEDISYVDKATKVSGREVKAILVKNVSGIALKPGQLVTWATGYVGRKVDGYARTTGGKIAGIVDDWLPAAGAADDQIFNLIVKGPVRVKSPTDNGGGDIASGDHLTADTATTAAATNSTTGGRAAKIDADTTNLTGEYERRIIGIALEANLSSNTDALFDACVDINIAD